MNQFSKIIFKGVCLPLAAALAFSGCMPEQADGELGPLPTASFEIQPVSGAANRYLLQFSGTGGFVYYWDKGNGVFAEGSATDTAYLPFQGDYEIKLRVVGAGGLAEAEKALNVPTTDPDACAPGSVLSRLTGCGTKTWILKQPEGGALFVGPPGLGSAWWSNSAGDVLAADRVCLFNNEYTFVVDGQFNYDDKGDFRVDDEGGAAWPTDVGLAIGCYSTDQLPEQYQAWGSGNHRFELNGSTELRLIGTGAHLGLYKVGQGGTIAAPEGSITYTIESISDTELVVKKEYGWGGWRFTLIPKP